MTATLDRHFAKVLTTLEQLGLLLVSGNEIPDVRRLITGKAAKGSWWSDPAAHTIFAVTERLSDHSDVLITKLISSKVTFVHRKLWSHFYSIATARDRWQMSGLSAEARNLFKLVDTNGSIATNKLRSFKAKPGDLARELERRLLVHAEQVHTDSGAHAKVLETWGTWATKVGFKPGKIETEAARQFFQKRLEQINKEYEGSGRLPWSFPK